MALIPLRAPGPEEPETAFLLDQIRDAQRTLDRAIIEAQALPVSVSGRSERLTRYNALKRQVDQAYRRATLAARGWSETTVPEQYARGHLLAAAQVGSQIGFGVLHREAIEQVSKDAYDDVATGLQQVPTQFSGRVDAQRSLEELGHSSRQLIRTAARAGVAQQVLVGDQSPADVARDLRDRIWEEDIDIIDRAGRRWNPEKYSRMLIRTKSANAFNVGTLNKYNQDRVHRVRVFDGTDDDAECAQANGEVWTISYAYEHVISHPNCRRAFGAALGNGRLQKATPQELALYIAKRGLYIGIERYAAREFRRWIAIGRIDIIPPELHSVRDRIEQTFAIPGYTEMINERLSELLFPALEDITSLQLPNNAYIRAGRRLGIEATAARQALFRVVVPEELQQPFDRVEYAKVAKEVKDILTNPQRTARLAIRDSLVDLQLLMDARGDMSVEEIEFVASLAKIAKRKEWDDVTDAMWNDLIFSGPRHLDVIARDALRNIPDHAQAFVPNPLNLPIEAAADRFMFRINPIQQYWARIARDTTPTGGRGQLADDETVMFLASVFDHRVTFEQDDGINGMVIIIDDLVFVKKVGFHTAGPVSARNEAITSLVARRMGMSRDLPVDYIPEQQVMLMGALGKSPRGRWTIGWNAGDDVLENNADNLAIQSIILDNEDQHHGNFMIRPVAAGEYEMVPIDMEFSMGSAGGGDNPVPQLGIIDTFYEEQAYALIDDIADPSWARVDVIDFEDSQRLVMPGHSGATLDDLGDDTFVVPHGHVAPNPINGDVWTIRTIVRDDRDQELIKDILEGDEWITDMGDEVAKALSDMDDLEAQRWIASVGGVASYQERRLRVATNLGVLDLFDEHEHVGFAGRTIREGDYVTLKGRTFDPYDHLERLSGKEEINGLVVSTLTNPLTEERHVLILENFTEDLAERLNAGDHVDLKWRVMREKDAELPPSRVLDEFIEEQTEARLDDIDATTFADYHRLTRPATDEQIARLNRRGLFADPQDPVPTPRWVPGTTRVEVDRNVLPQGVLLNMPEFAVDRVLNQLDGIIREVTAQYHPDVRPINMHLTGAFSDMADRGVLGVYNPTGFLKRLAGAPLNMRPGITFTQRSIAREIEDMTQLARRHFNGEITDEGLLDLLDDLDYDNLVDTIHHEMSHAINDVQFTVMREQLMKSSILRVIEENSTGVNRELFDVANLEDLFATPAELHQALRSRLANRVDKAILSVVDMQNEMVANFWLDRGLNDLDTVRAAYSDIPEALKYPLYAYNQGPTGFLYGEEFMAEVATAFRQVTRGYQDVLAYVGDEFLVFLRRPWQTFQHDLVDLVVTGPEPSRTPMAAPLRRMLKLDRQTLEQRPDLTPERYDRIVRLRFDHPGRFTDPAVLEATYAHDFGRFRTVINGRISEGDTRIEGRLVLPDGEDIGRFTRDVTVKPDGSVSVYHASLFIVDRYQGAGFGTEFFEWTEDMYIAKGVQEIRVSTAQIGGYNWARRGYDFVNPESGFREIVEPRSLERALVLLEDLGIDVKLARAKVEDLFFQVRVLETFGGFVRVGSPADAIDNLMEQVNHVVHDTLPLSIQEIVEDSGLDPRRVRWVGTNWPTDLTHVQAGSISEAQPDLVVDPIWRAYAHGVFPHSDEDPTFFRNWLVEIVSTLADDTLAAKIDKDLGVVVGVATTEVPLPTRPHPLISAWQAANKVTNGRLLDEVIAGIIEDRHWTSFDLSQWGSDVAVEAPDRNVLLWLGKQIMINRGWSGVKPLSQYFPGVQSVIEPILVDVLAKAKGVTVEVGKTTVHFADFYEPRLASWTGAATEAFTFEMYNPINRALRDEIGAWPELVELIKHIDNELDKGPSLDELRRLAGMDVTFRGSSQPLSYWEDLVGQTFTTPSYMSSTPTSEVLGFARDDYLVAIKLHDGTLARFINAEQAEIVFPRGSRFTVNGITQVDVEGKPTKLVVLQDLAEREVKPIEDNVRLVPTSIHEVEERANSTRNYVPVEVELVDGRVLRGAADPGRGHIDIHATDGEGYTPDSVPYAAVQKVSFLVKESPFEKNLRLAAEREAARLTTNQSLVPQIQDSLRRGRVELGDRWSGTAVQLRNNYGQTVTVVVNDVQFDRLLITTHNNQYNLNDVDILAIGNIMARDVDTPVDTGSLPTDLLEVFSPNHYYRDVDLFQRDVMRFAHEFTQAALESRPVSYLWVNEHDRLRFQEIERRLLNLRILDLIPSNIAEFDLAGYLTSMIDEGNDLEFMFEGEVGDLISALVNSVDKDQADDLELGREVWDDVIDTMYRRLENEFSLAGPGGVLDVEYWMINSVVSEYDVPFEGETAENMLVSMWRTYTSETGMDNRTFAAAYGFLAELERVGNDALFR